MTSASRVTLSWSLSPPTDEGQVKLPPLPSPRTHALLSVLEPARGSGTCPGLGRVEETRPAPGAPALTRRRGQSRPATCPSPPFPRSGSPGARPGATLAGVSRPGLSLPGRAAYRCVASMLPCPCPCTVRPSAEGRAPGGAWADCSTAGSGSPRGHTEAWGPQAASPRATAGRPASGRFLPLPTRDPGPCAENPRLTEGLEHILAPLGLTLNSSSPSPGGTSCGAAQGPIPAGHRCQV